MNLLINHIVNLKTAFFIFILISILASTQSILLKEKTFGNNPTLYTHYNNYKIFKQSFYHLIQGKDLYSEYPEEHYDYFKYSPTFALFFGLFAVFPDLLGLTAWNILNALLLFFAIYTLPNFQIKQKAIVLILCTVELMTSLQNEQSNGVMAGLFILSFAFLERRNYLWATFCLVCSVYLKIFGIVAFALVLFYPNKVKISLYIAVWSILLLFFPLLVINHEQLFFLYKSWIKLIQADHSASFGYSVMGWVQSWFGYVHLKNKIVVVGFILVLLPFIRIKMYSQNLFRFLMLCSLLIWSVIFNHKAESPTFIIAWVGIALWFIQSPKTKITWSLFLFAFIFTCLSPTDLFPKLIKETIIIPYNLKVLPCILVWVKLLFDQWMFSSHTNQNNHKYAFRSNTRI